MAGVITSRPKLSFRIPNPNAAADGRGGRRRRWLWRRRSERHGRLGDDGDLRDVQHERADDRAELRGLRPRVPPRRKSTRIPQLRLNLDAQLLGEQPVFNTIARIPGTEKPNEYVMLSGALRFVGRLVGRDGQRHGHDHDDGSDEDSETGVSASQAHHSRRPLERRGRGRSRLGGVPRGPSGGASRGSQALFNQDNGTGRVVGMSAGGLPDADAHVRHWLDVVPTEFKEQMQVRRRRATRGRRQRRLQFLLRRAAGVRPRRVGLGLRQLHLAHRPRHVRQDRVRRSQGERDADGDARLSRVGRSDADRAHESGFGARGVRQGATATDSQRAGRARGARRFGGPRAWPECEKAPSAAPTRGSRRALHLDRSPNRIQPPLRKCS